MCAPIFNLRTPGSAAPIPRRVAGWGSGCWLRLSVVLLVAGFSAVRVSAQSLPLELHYNTNAYNLQKTNGVPLSGVVNTPPGSDGRAPSNPFPNTNQFQSVVTFGGGVVPASSNLIPGLSIIANAIPLNLPRTINKSVVMLRARVGAPFVSQNISLLFGSIVPPPETDEYGVLLTDANPTNSRPSGIAADDYWFPEPASLTGHTNSGYYWSPHAQAVFAVNPGPLTIVWRKALPGTNQPPTTGVSTTNQAGSDYIIYTNRYLVSGSPAKKPRLMYWTEKSFRATGKPISVPTSRVGAVNPVYNNNFTRTVTNEFVAPGQTSPTDGGTNQSLAELRTLWYDSQLGQILAYNLEGRAFVELLGDVQADGVTRVHLGYEIVDVIKQPNPHDVTIELGDRLTAYPNGDPSDSDLFPEPIQVVGSTFAFRHNINGSEQVEYFATRETRNLNDLQVHWLEEGLEGLKWPLILTRYRLIWPPNSARYSHYVRPLVVTEAEAKKTAVPLPTGNAPIIDYQDPLDQPRGKLTEKFEYYTFLTTNFPAHRGLIRYTSGDYVTFERVFSWLDQTLKSQIYSNTVATNLTAWNPTNKTLQFASDQVAPRVVNLAVNVGDRISAPSSEIGAYPDTNYLAGYILKTNGNSFDPNGYVDPFVAGFDLANLGAIIPVNAIPGKNSMEVWWFRKNSLDFSDLAHGFKYAYWPSVIGHYTLQWPANASEIILASNDGSGGLTSLQAKGRIYYQNDASVDGYNPNEEHALMQGGQAFALRDDLNITATNGYTSDPFVLLEYTETDGRLAIRPFKVLREKPSAGILFDYAVSAGAVLQPPMPLPLLEKPMAPPVVGQPPKTLNSEILSWSVGSDSPASSGGLTIWTIATTERHYFRTFQALALQNSSATPPTPTWIYPTNATATNFIGLASNRRPYPLALWTGDGSTNANRFRYGLDDFSQLSPGTTVIVANPVNKVLWTATVTETNGTNGYIELNFGVPVDPLAQIATDLILPKSGGQAGQFDGFRAALEPLPVNVTDQGVRAFYSSFTYQDRKGNEWVYRGPHNPADHAAMVMKFYYKTLPGFYFPTFPLNGQPPAGTITPYLRARNPNGTFDGNPVYGNSNNDADGDGQSLGIIYRPEWPDDAPVLQMAETLTLPKRGLPQVRGQSSIQILYQQPQVAGDVVNRAVVLHDPTREKSFTLGAATDTTRLGAIPDSVKTSTYRGKVYFPNLAPHLVDRFFFDPSDSKYGTLKFRGEFVDSPVGDKYVLLNVLGAQDRAALKFLADKEPAAKKALWDAAVDGLSTAMEKFVEDTGKPGTYKSNGQPIIDGPTQLAEVVDDDVAVDSYALTAVGPGTGYVTLIAGNGLAFTPVDEPVAVKVIKVTDTLYRGEVNVIESSNPLNEKLTLQQVVDLAGAVENYRFEWKIAAPVDGLPPTVYQNTPAMLMGNGTWNHIRYPLPGDQPATIARTAASRISHDIGSSVSPVTRIGYDSVALQDEKLWFFVNSPQFLPHYLVPGNHVVVRTVTGAEIFGTIHSLTTPNVISVVIDPGQNQGQAQAGVPPADSVLELYERREPGARQSIAYREFIQPAGANYSQLWLSMDIESSLGGRIYIDGQPAVTVNLGDEDTTASSAPAGLTPLSRTYNLPPSMLGGGVKNADGTRTHRVVAELYSSAVPGAFQDFNVRIEAFASVDVTAAQWIPLDPTHFLDGIRAIVGESADVRSLSDNYLIMRYQAGTNTHASWQDINGTNAAWSQWTTPALAEGWIKRVLKGINPFNQRVTDLFNNQVNTDVSLITQAGQRWEGDVALNLDSINNAGLIEIYETVLNRGKLLSLNAGINYGPANDALLLAAGYLNDLYMLVGNEAWADAANPTIGIGTKDKTYGDIATALFSFKGQQPSLLEEELALLRGRDDFLLPGVELRPVYNRLIWNFTRGIDAGEVIYSLNYNILDQDDNGKVDANDARIMYPQGHGDAYGHYLTALKGYYTLLLDENFDWVPRIEAVTVLGKPVSVDYQDERKFAAAAAAAARTGRQIFDLTWRRDYISGRGLGWKQFAATKSNTSTRNVPTTRFWGMDHWAARTGQGAYFNWVVGNAMLPDHDPDPAHTGSIQQIDRTTVPELKELPSVVQDLQTDMDGAEGGLTPLGLPENTIPFDINPSLVASGDPQTHFEQIYARAKTALQNALASFDDAKDVTRLMRSEQDSLADFKATVEKQELAYTNSLIELYGTPYPNDIGPGKTFRTGFTGPDTIHYMYVDTPELSFTGMLKPQEDVEWKIDTQTFVAGWSDGGISDFNFVTKARTGGVDGTDLTSDYTNKQPYVVYNLSSHGFFKKPSTWTGKRVSPGSIQQAISDIIKARNSAYQAFYNVDGAKGDLDWAIRQFELKKNSHETIRDFQLGELTGDQVVATANLAYEIAMKYLDQTKEQISSISQGVANSLPTVFIAGLAAGGDLTAPARGAIEAAGVTFTSATSWGQVIAFSAIKALDYANATAKRFIDFYDIEPEQWNQELRDATSDLRNKVYAVQNMLPTINQRLQELDDAQRRYQALLAQGDRIQDERLIFRQRAAAVIQGYRTRDAAFRVFRNEKLERYKTLFDLAARYAFMSAQAFDYETGLLHTDQGKEFIARIVHSRALGVMRNGEPQFAGSDTGDPGLSSTMAEMFADWVVLKGRLGFNNPDTYGTTASIRSEYFRVLPGTNGDTNWREILNRSRRSNLLDDSDIRRACMQLDPGNGLPVPGIVLEFETTITDGQNLFNQALAAGDHSFTPSSFATKIYASGVALQGYIGMDDPAANGFAVSGSGGSSPTDPTLISSNPDALAATPYVYLIPTGVDSMRSPPLGDAGVIRTWSVADVAIPLPFNVGGSTLSTANLWTSTSSLSEDPWVERKHQAFRPVSDPVLFGAASGSLQRSQFTNRRLIGRSVWNSKWKLVIPGKTLLNNPDEGLDRFIRTVTDVKLHWETYSYSGN